jgi:hypothetical protein
MTLGRLRLMEGAVSGGDRLEPCSSKQLILLSQQRDDLIVLLLPP